jgi:nitrogen fixation NifU-like protein
VSDLEELYQELVLDHGKRPRNHRVIEDATGAAEGFNPLCGDRLTVYVRTRDGSLEDVSFVGSGCAICTASASLMAQHVRGMDRRQAQAVFQDFQRLLTDPVEHDPPASVGKLAALAGVRRYPMRVKCATLPWHTLNAALDMQPQVVTTE